MPKRNTRCEYSRSSMLASNGADVERPPTLGHLETTRSTPSCENRGSVASSSTRNCRRLEGYSCTDARLDRVSRDHDALDTWNVFGRVLLEVAHVAGPDVEMDDRGLLVQINDRFPGLPSHADRSSDRGPRDGLKAVSQYSVSIK